MKARIKATGEIIEVSLSHIIYDGGKKIIWYNTPQGASFTEDELEFIDTEENFDYWTRLEHTFAGMALQGILSNNVRMNIIRETKEETMVNIVTNLALNFAHSLVEKYKKEERK